MSVQIQRDDDDPLPNPKRGCGHLKPGKAYIIGGGFSPGGVLPSWVELDPYLPYREVGTEGEFTRGYQHIDGLTLQLALGGNPLDPDADGIEFVPHYPDELYDETRGEAHKRALENHLDAGVYDGAAAIPETEADRHIDRIRHRGAEGGVHWGDIPATEQTDLLMRAGETYYEAPVDYAQEAIRHGLSKAIPVTRGKAPPDVVPGITRCWILHPAACEGYGGGIIGYAYLSEVAFTEPDEGELPSYIEDYESAGRLAVRGYEDPEPPEEDTALDDFDGDAGGDADG